MIHQTDNDDQQHNDFFTFSRPPQLPRYSHKTQEARLVIVAQPADHHRARYESEGSRGAVKDQSGESSPKIKLEGYRGPGPVPVHVFVANEKGPSVKPHVFFRTCKIASRNSTPCEDDTFILDGVGQTEGIKINLTPKDDYCALIDCVGILKLRNADVENESKSKAQPKPKRRNPTVRLAFHATIPADPDRGFDSRKIIVASNPISCSQPEGQPEILRMSTNSGSSEGGDELFIAKILIKIVKLCLNWEAGNRPEK